MLPEMLQGLTQTELHGEVFMPGLLEQGVDGGVGVVQRSECH